MKRLECVAAATLLFGLLLPSVVGAQTRPEPSVPPVLERSVEMPEVKQDVDLHELGRMERGFAGGQVLRIGQDYLLAAGEAAHDVLVVFGDVAIDGHVDRDVVVVLGQARLASTANIAGALIVVGGSAVAAQGARVGADLVVIGGELTAPAEFTPRGEHIVVGPAAFGGRLKAVVPWLMRGLLWGRLIVPSLPWMWSIVGALFLVYLAINLVFHHPAGACAATVATRPLTAFATGLLVLLLIGPVCLLLTLSVVGVLVVPVALCAIFVAGIIGKVGVTRWVGMSVMPQQSLDARLPSLRSFVIGFAVICVAYMVPLLGLVTWTLVGVLGLGSATLAFLTAYRRENPAPVRRAVRPPDPPRVPDMGEGVGHRPADTAPAPAAAPAYGAVLGSDLAAFPHAFFLERLAAFVLDVILVLIVKQILFAREQDSLFFLLLLTYHVVFWTWKSTTIGGIICQLRVVRIDGAPVRFIDALVRGLSSIFSLLVVGLGGLWILKDPERQSWHDKIAGTYVVRVPRNLPL